MRDRLSSICLWLAYKISPETVCRRMDYVIGAAMTEMFWPTFEAMSADDLRPHVPGIHGALLKIASSADPAGVVLMGQQRPDDRPARLN